MRCNIISRNFLWIEAGDSLLLSVLEPAQIYLPSREHLTVRQYVDETNAIVVKCLHGHYNVFQSMSPLSQLLFLSDPF